MQLDLPETGKSLSLNRFVLTLGLSSKMSLVPAHDQLLKLTILPEFSCSLLLYFLFIVVEICILNFASIHSDLLCTIFKIRFSQKYQFHINGLNRQL